MRKLFLIGLMLTFSCATVSAEDVTVQKKKPHCPEYPRGPKGKKGPRGSKGDPGIKGKTGPKSSAYRISDIIEVTSISNAALNPGDLISFSPIVYPTNGILTGLGLALVEAVPGSSVFNTILLPASNVETYYAVTFGVSVSGPTGLPNPVFYEGVFQLFLNGIPLPYTNLGVGLFTPNPQLVDQTSYVINPPSNAPSSLTLRCLNHTLLQPVTALGFSAYMTVVKLN